MPRFDEDRILQELNHLGHAWSNEKMDPRQKHPLIRAVHTHFESDLRHRAYAVRIIVRTIQVPHPDGSGKQSTSEAVANGSLSYTTIDDALTDRYSSRVDRLREVAIFCLDHLYEVVINSLEEAIDKALEAKTEVRTDGRLVNGGSIQTDREGVGKGGCTRKIRFKKKPAQVGAGGVPSASSRNAYATDTTLCSIAPHVRRFDDDS